MATLVLDNTLYQCYATIAEQNNINVTDAMTETLRLLKQQLKKKPSLSLSQRLEKRILELRDLPANWDYEGSPSISSEACDYNAMEDLQRRCRVLCLIVQDVLYRSKAFE